MQPSDRLICALLQPQPKGFQFKQWMLHVTIVPWLRLAMSPEQFAAELKKVLVGSHPFEISVGQEAQFGYRKRKLVNLIESPELIRLEGQTRRFLHAQKAWVVDEADRTRGKYRPHVTAQVDGRMHEGETFVCDRLYVVRQSGDYKEIEAEIIL